jgi:hypothetical protein
LIFADFRSNAISCEYLHFFPRIHDPALKNAHNTDLGSAPMATHPINQSINQSMSQTGEMSREGRGGDMLPSGITCCAPPGRDEATGLNNAFNSFASCSFVNFNATLAAYHYHGGGGSISRSDSNEFLALYGVMQ